MKFKAGFREEVDKFIEAAKKHATILKENNDTIICSCKDCKNRMTLTCVTIIISYLIMRGFVEDYTVWIYHGKTVVVNDEDEEEYDDETIESLSQYSELDARMDFEFGNEQGGDAGGWDGNDEGGATNDGGPHVGDENDYDDLEEMIRALGPEILLNSLKGLENLKRVKKIIEGDYVWC